VTDDFEPRRKFRKKLKKHEGQNWDQSDLIDALEEAKRKGRLLCKRCGKHKPWSKLRVSYERISKRWIQQVWYCPDCGNALQSFDICVRPKKKERTKP
jgi:hypothetical protein